ncbi:uncharacterized protein BT62DRAFT_1074481 [Guyanagaster necrorhizus]|uniref:BTB domain-containing protein n=1 Tax=Guyanagaster necrorhizus TaxID=856835 RepID=A0A9P8ATZ6_9AGAR|nr:uncharacterized protein BT62DRAFT_1074481 [Guyanagaster necrorhizus MCA 3950]KAG7447948.1 hypothetical protein BT62DRAFT_1074481 [Guyanagaster necrorhizus MCA 3950]
MPQQHFLDEQPNAPLHCVPHVCDILYAPSYEFTPSFPPTMAVVASTSSCLSQSRYHPLFSSPDADVVLSSSDDTLYQVDAYTLRTTCGLFRTMFSLPRPQRSHAEDEESKGGDDGSGREPIPTYEPAATLTPLLLLLFGLPLPKSISSWSYDDLERILTLAENWDAQGPISFIRGAVSCPRFTETDPLRFYAIAAHFGWEEEMRLAAKFTLRIDMFNLSDEQEEVVAKISSKDFLPLLHLRRRRTMTFRALINDVGRFSAGNDDGYVCGRCGVTKMDNRTWRAFREALTLEIDQRPLGDGVSGLAVGGIRSGEQVGIGCMSWAVAERCWAARCEKAGCGAVNYDRLMTLKEIKKSVDELPWF